MRKLKGITINGEWLGDNVVINANFRAICNLAPFVMQEFAKLVNSIDKLNSAVAINNFYFPDNNTVDIKFSNNNFSGLANLCFHLQQGLPELVNRSLTIYSDELECPSETETKNAEEILEERTDIKEVSDINQEFEEDNEVLSIADNKTECNNEILSEDEVNESIDTSDTKEIEDVLSDEKEIILDENSSIDTKNAISMMVEDIAAKAPTLAPIQIQVVQQPQETNQKVEGAEKEIVEQEIVEQEDVSEPISEIKNEDEEISDTEDLENSIIENDEIEEVLPIKETSSETFNDTELSARIDKNISDFDFIVNDGEYSAQTKVEEISCNDLIETEQERNTIENSIENNEENSVENIKETNEPEISEEQKEEIQDCLSDFYGSTQAPTIEEIEFKGADNLAMQAMLNEMFILREELNKLKNEKITYEDLFGKKEKMKNNIEDEDADFRIMGSEERVNASILDEELFVAGDKLYKWGETLYLDE